MASWRETVRPLRQLRVSQISRQPRPLCPRRWYSAEAAAAAPAETPATYRDLEPDSTQLAPGPSIEQIEEFKNPKKRAEERKFQLPSNRCDPTPTTPRRGLLALALGRPLANLGPLRILLDTNTTRPNSAAAPSTPYNRHPPPTPSRATSKPGRSTSPASRRRGRRPSRRTCWR